MTAGDGLCKRTEFRILIPARSGSKGVPGKNLRQLGGLSLLERSIRVALEITDTAHVWCSTDSPQIREAALAAGCTVPFLRPTELALDTTPDVEVFRHAMQFEIETSGVVTEYWIHLRPTTPIRETNVVNNALDLFVANARKVTSLRSIDDEPIYLEKLLSLSESGTGLTWDGSPAVDTANQPRQFSRVLWRPNGYVDVVTAREVLTRNQMHGNRCLLFKTPKTVDIDNEQDLALAMNQLGQILP